MVTNRKRSIIIDLVVDDSEAEKLDRLGTNVESSAKSLGTLASSAKLAIGTVARSAITGFITDTFEMAAAAEANTRRANVVFGNNADEIEAWAERNASAFGKSVTDTIGFASAIGDLLIPLGFTREEAALIAPAVAEAGNAFAEFTGRSTEDAVHAVASALLGRTRRPSRASAWSSAKRI